jgi:hypothetical protein
MDGGHARNRTGLNAFAERCVTNPPRGPIGGLATISPGFKQSRDLVASVLSAGGVPAFRKRNQRPRSPVVVGGARRLIAGQGLGQEIILRFGRNSRLHGIQQKVEFNFTHRALRVRELTMPKGFCFQIERIARILMNARSRQVWLLKRFPGWTLPPPVRGQL